jgi:DNA-binding IclR family transcriptional regulator
MSQAVLRELASRNGGPGLTVAELSGRLGSPQAVIRQVLSALVFREKQVTCGRDGRYVVGSPDRLLTAPH